MSEPDFFLSTAGEYTALTRPRACWVRGRLKDVARDDHMLVEIDPSLIDQNYGPGIDEITRLILSARFVGSSLFPVTEWPGHVYVSRIVDDSVARTLTIARGQVELIAWGVIYRTLDEANANARKFGP